MRSIILPPLSALYGAVTRARLTLYRRGTFRTTTLDRPVISVGNITTGGTGKTPLVEWVARTLAAEGKKVCILTRGYGRSHPDRHVLVSDGQTVFATASEAGDEAYLLAKNLEGVAAVISDANRAAAGKDAIKHLNPDCFVLDDGFQHLRLARDLNIVTIDATNPWGGDSLLPYGRLREPRSSLSRADCLVITRADQAEGIQSLRSELAQLTGGCPQFLSSMRTVRIARLSDSSKSPELPKRSAAFCAVGNPQSFFTQLRDEGQGLSFTKAFTDHYSYTQKDLDRLVNAAKKAGAEALITTAKDAVKLQSLTIAMPCYILEISIDVENSEELRELIRRAAGQSSGGS
jgi:tetraacyldisaccharide 4'-kinase